MTQTINDRIRHLIEVAHGGSVNAAAEVMRIPQRTLARIVAGTSVPRADAVARIAHLYQVPSEWLLSGHGEGPREDADWRWRAEQRRWTSLLDSLDLPPVTASMVSWYPMAGAIAPHLLDAEGRAMALGLPTPEVHAQIPTFYEQAALHFRAAVSLVQGLVEHLGRDNARRLLIANALLFRTRFTLQAPVDAAERSALGAEQRKHLGAEQAARDAQRVTALPASVAAYRTAVMQGFADVGDAEKPDTKQRKKPAQRRLSPRR